MKMVSRKAAGQRRVYDIEVEGVHNFYANGVNVHNCATEGGVSVIKDDGTVVDSGLNARIRSVGWAANGLFYDTGSNPFALRFVADIRSVSDGFSESRRWRRWRKGNTAPVIGFSDSEFRPVSDGKTDSFGLGRVVPGLFRLVRGNGDLIARVTSSHTTGWMNGDIKGAFLSDTDDTDLVGQELVTNGDFSAGSTGWELNRFSIENEQAVFGDTWGANSLKSIDSVEAGKTYMFSVTHISDDNPNALKIYAGENVQSSFGTPPANSTTNLIRFVTVDTSGRIEFRFTSPSGVGEIIDNISVKLADADRSVNNNGLIVNGTVTRSPVAPGADLVAYSGFSGTNYLEQPYNPDLDFGTGDFCVMGWAETSNTAGANIANRGNDSTLIFAFFVDGGDLSIDTGTLTTATGAFPSEGVWKHVAACRKDGVMHLYVNGEELASQADTQDISATDEALFIGVNRRQGNPWNGSLALWRISATAPTPEQIKRIYEDEKVLFQENAQATLYGNSDAVTALAHDEVTDLLHVGTSDGRSVFQGLRRVDNTTDPVNTAISASGGMVVEE